MTDQEESVPGMDIEASVEIKEPPEDWRLRYVVDYFVPKMGSWELKDRDNLAITIPIVHDEGGETVLTFNVTGDDLVKIRKSLDEQEGPELEFEQTDSMNESGESGFNLLVNSFSFSLPDGEPQDLKALRPDNKRFQNMKLILWTANHPSYVDSSVYYPRVNALYTPFPTSLPIVMGIGHESGHCIDSEEHPEDYKFREEDLKKSKQELLKEQVPREDRAWSKFIDLIVDLNNRKATKIDVGFVKKYKEFYLGNYQLQAEGTVVG
jgi:hypothetical protein